MEKLISIIEQSEEFPDFEVAKCVHEIHSELAMLPVDLMSQKLNSISSFLNNLERTESHDKIKFYIAVLAIILFPRIESLPEFSFYTDNGKLFSVIITIYTMKEKKMPHDLFISTFQNNLKEISTETLFYDISPLHYFHHFAEMVRISLNPDDFISLTTEFLNLFLPGENQIPTNHLNHSSIFYISNLIRPLVHHMINHPNKESTNMISLWLKFFDYIFSLPNVNISLILLQFLHPWYVFTRFCSDKTLKIKLENHIQLISNLFRKVTTSKMHELYRFPWYLVILLQYQYQDPKWRYNCLCLILIAFKTIMKIQEMRNMIDSAREFVEKMKHLYTSNPNQISYYTILSFLDSCFRQYSESFINPIIPDLHWQPRPLYKKNIYFFDQGGSLNSSIDNFLYTTTNVREYDATTFKPALEALIHKYDVLKSKMTTAQFFLLPLFEISFNNPENLAYIPRIISTVIRCLYTIEYANLVLSSLEFPIKKKPDYQKCTDMFLKLIPRIPHYVHPTFAQMAAKILWKYTKKFIITASALKIIQKFPDNIFEMVLKEGTNIVTDNFHLLFSKSYFETYYFCRYIIILLRLSTVGDAKPSYLETIKDFKKVISNTVFNNLKKITNQTIVFQMVTVLLKQPSINQVTFQFKSSLIEDVLPSAKKAFLFPFLSLISSVVETIKIQQICPLLEYALRNGDDDTIAVASNLCCKIFSFIDRNASENHPNNEKMNGDRPSKDNPYILPLFKAWYHAPLSQQQKLDFVEFIPKFPHLFTQIEEPKTISVKISFGDLFNEIYKSLTDDTEAILNAFNLFSIYIFTPDLDHVQTLALLRIFTRCLSYKFLESRIHDLIPKFLIYHINLFLQCKTNMLFLCLLEVPFGSKAVVSSIIHDIALSFMSIVIERNPNCPMIEKTVQDTLHFSSYHERVHTTLAGFSIYVRLCPQYVTIDAMRCFLISTNEVHAFDLSFNQSFTDLLNSYIKTLDQEKSQEFIDMTFRLFGTMPLSFRLVVVRVMSSVRNAALPSLDMIEKSKYKSLIMQQLAAVLNCSKNIDNSIVTATIKLLSEKNDRLTFTEKLSRKMSLYIGTMSNETIFRRFIQEPGFSVKLISFMSNTIATSFKSLRLTSKECFDLLINHLDKDKQCMKIIYNHLEDPIGNKIFTYFNEYSDRMHYFKRLAKIVPTSVKSALVIDFINAVDEYTKKSDDDKVTFLSNCKCFFSFLGVKDYISQPSTKESIFSISPLGKSYFNIYTECLVKLLYDPHIPYRSIIGKRAFNFLICFPKETVSRLLQISYPTLLYFMQNECSQSFHEAFIASCQKLGDVLHFPTYYFDILFKMSKIKECLQNTLYIEFINSCFASLLSAFQTLPPHITWQLLKISSSLLNIVNYTENIHSFIEVTKVFNYPLFLSSNLYSKYVKKCFKLTSDEFKRNLITTIIQNTACLNNSLFDNVLSHAIKYSQNLSEELISILWGFLSDSKYIVSVTRMLKKNVPAPDVLIQVVKMINIMLNDSDTTNIVYSEKAMLKLLKLKLLPADQYWKFIQTCFRVFKFMDPPFVSYSLRFFKLMESNFPDIPESIIPTITYFIHNKFNSAREIQRLMDIWAISPSIRKILPFSPILFLSSFLDSRIYRKEPPKLSYDPILAVAIKYLNTVDVPKHEIDKFFKSAYVYLDLMIKEMTFNTFPDFMAAYANKHDIIEPPSYIIETVLKNKINLPSFIVICLLAKYNKTVLLTYQQLATSALDFVENEDVPVNPLSLQKLVEFMCQEPSLNPSVLLAYNNFIAKFNDKNQAKIFAIFAAMMKSGKFIEYHENMWKLMIVKNRTEILDYLSEKEQLRFIEYIETYTTNLPDYFIKTAEYSIESDLVSKKAKCLIISKVAPTISKVNVSQVFTCIDKIKRYSERSNLNFSPYITEMLIEAARCSKQINRLKCIQMISEIIPPYYDESNVDSTSNDHNGNNFDFLDFIFNQLPSISWRNETLIYLISLFAIKDKKWMIIFSFSNSLRGYSEDFAVHFLQHVVNERYSGIIHNFFLRILNVNNIKSFSYIISSLLHCFAASNLHIHPKIAIKAAISINRPEYINYYLDNEVISIYDETIFKHNDINDELYSKFSQNYDISLRTAIALSLLGKYQQSYDIYSQFDEPVFENWHFKNLLADKIYRINHQFLIDDNNNYYITQPLKNVSQWFNYNFPMSHVSEALSLGVSGNSKGSISAIQKSQMVIIEMIQPNSSYMKRELIAASEIALRMIKLHALQNPIPPLNNQFITKTLNHSFLNDLENMYDLIIRKDDQNYQNLNYDENCIMLLPPSYNHTIKHISGITNKGLIAINGTQLEEYLQSMINNLSKPPKETEIMKFAPICFEAYTISPSDELFYASYSSYALAVNGCIEYPPYLRQESTARIVTLLRIADDSQLHVAKENSGIFSHKNLEVWRLWLGQLVDLTLRKELASVIAPLFLEMGYRALLYARKKGNTDIINFLSLKLPGSMMPLDLLEKSLNLAFSGNLEQNEEEVKNIMNCSFPFVFPYQNSPISLYRVSGKPYFLSPDMLMLTLATTTCNQTPVLIQRTTNSEGFSSSVMTFANTIHLMKIVMESSYITRHKGVIMSAPFVFEVGKNYLLTLINGRAESLQTLFETHKKTRNLIHEQANIKTNDSTNKFVKDSLNVENCDSSNTFRNYIMKNLTSQGFFIKQNSLLKSAASQAVVRHMLSADYPSLERYIFCSDVGTMPVIHIDFDSYSFTQNIEESSFRYSPNIESLFGEFGKNKFHLMMAATASSFVEQLESIRSCIEVLVGDDPSIELKGADFIIQERNIVEDKLFQIAPTSGISATPEDSIAWMNGLTQLMERAMNQSLQPQSAMPWF
ncbi:hypothetical protein TRFO_29084 [Tritrichomonas foetus]|uniref:Uncharacterized protein n=1 Tax=Tritrichomonas foetus TaxID=1144522 RepID=A0A1J4JXX0_9EUKA|nr:hypothetical protein TRFO_29084 [Tritrichomonas foetus]|eukprot:OHT03530.1 hypothetical protein TRFO_29084 [Tritrichomonas foetus]